MPFRLRIGVIGLGRRWRRYRPALAGLRDRLVVRAVCDQRPARAERAAREIGCAAAAGPTDLLDRDDVQAVLLLDAQWFGLWPLEQAARMGKPVFCAVSPVCDDAHADDVMRRVREAGLPVMAALAPGFAPAVTRLRNLLTARFGPPRLVRCDWCGSGTRDGFDLPGTRVLPSLMHACAGLIEGEPASVWTTAAEGARLASVLLEFRGGRAAQLNLWTGTGAAGMSHPGRDRRRRRHGGPTAHALLARRRRFAHGPGAGTAVAAAAAGAVPRCLGRRRTT